jgi:hypothetical protein
MVNDQDVGVCEFIKGNIYIVAFFGYCSAGREVATALGIIGPNLNPMEFLLSQMRDRLETNQPNVFAAYIYSPGHTKQSFNYDRQSDIDEYREWYLKRSMTTARWLQDLIDFIEIEDPAGILYVMGDHGPWLSRATRFDDDETFYVQDRHGIFGGVFPNDRCERSFENPYTEEYTRVSQVSLQILRCLSGGDEAFRTVKADDLIYIRPLAGYMRRYEDYSYE